MMTLRNECQNEPNGSRRRARQPPDAMTLLSDDDPTVVATCPRCQRQLTAHRFSTGDGLSIITYHCFEHGDVIPARDLAARDY